MNDIITGEAMVDSTDFFDPRRFKKYFTADNEPIYVPIGECDGNSSGEQDTHDAKRRNTGKRLKKSPDRCIFYTANDVAEILDVSLSQAYKIIQSLNTELEKLDYIVLAGRISKAFFHEKYYGMERMLSEQKK